jgi:hypothetical protein
MRSAAALVLLVIGAGGRTSGGLGAGSVVGFISGFIGGSGFLSSASRLQAGDKGVIDKFMSGLAERVGGNIPEEDIRTVRSGDLNHDGVPDVAVLFTIEGPGNNYGRYLAVFIRIQGKLTPIDHATVGGKYYRAIEMKSIQGDVIYFSTTGYAERDPACCPTVHGTTRYELVGDKLKELTHD